MTTSDVRPQLGDVCVLGLGKTGEAVARWCARHLGERVASVTLYGGGRSTEGPATQALADAGVRVVLGTEQVEGHYDLCVASPGIPPHSAFFQSARAASDELVGEPELAWRLSPKRWVAITGTNGKTTTTTLVSWLLDARRGGRVHASECVGNIGTPAISLVDDRACLADGRPCWFVAELSSFQLEESSQLAPVTACLLNVTPDHLSWHGSMEAYAAAKERVFANFGPHDLAVVSDEDAWCRAVTERLEARGVPVCRIDVQRDPDTPHAAFVREDSLVVRLDGRERLVYPLADFALKGAHNAQNALAALAMTLWVGCDPDDLAAGLRGFSPLEHRIEPCGELAGVRFVNDSKATNTDAVEKALTAFAPGTVVLLMGGHDKGTDLASVAGVAAATARVVVCFGDAGPRIAEAVEAAGGPAQVLRAPHLADALETACGVARPGDTVLLSPACSSFDEFSSFEERGRVFKQLVADRIAAAGGA